MFAVSSQSRRIRFGTGACAVVLLAGCAAGGGASTAPTGSTGVTLDKPAVAGQVKAGALAGVSLNFVSYGGVFQEGQESAAVKPFATASGAQVGSDGPTDYAKIKAQVDSNNVTWDVVDTDSTWATANCGTLLQPLNYDLIDKSKIPTGLAAECTVPAMQYGYVLMYNTDLFGANPPQGWADFFDTTKFPGKRGFYGNAGELMSGGLEAALIGDGVDPAALYPLDTKRALAKLASIRDDLVFWTTGAQSQQQMESGEVAMTMVWSGRAYGAVKNGAPFAPQWNQAFKVQDLLSVPKNAKNPDASMALINYYLGAQQQAAMTEATSYAPVNTDAKPALDSLGQEYLVTSPAIDAKMLQPDTAWWAANQAGLLETWAAWLNG